MSETSADGLLEVARHLATQAATQSGRAQDAFARRAVSTAYYAVFHLLLDALDEELAKTSWQAFAHEVVRGVDHDRLKEIAVALDIRPKVNREPYFRLRRRRLWNVVLDAEPDRLKSELRRFAQIVVELQTERHRADYNRGQLFDSSSAGDAVALAQEAFQLWRGGLAATQEARVLLLALLRLEGREEQP